MGLFYIWCHFCILPVDNLLRPHCPKCVLPPWCPCHEIKSLVCCMPNTCPLMTIRFPSFFIQGHDVSVHLAWDNGDFSGLIHIHDIVDGYLDFPAPLSWLVNDVCVWCSFFLLSWSNPLSLLLHVAFFCFGGLWKAVSHCSHGWHWLQCKEPCIDCFDLHCFCWVSCCCMVVFDDPFNARQLMYTVDAAYLLLIILGWTCLLLSVGFCLVWQQ